MTTDETRQQTLDGRTIRDRQPTGPRAAVLDRFPAHASIPVDAPWVALAREHGTERVLGWIARADAEGVI